MSESRPAAVVADPDRDEYNNNSNNNHDYDDDYDDDCGHEKNAYGDPFLVATLPPHAHASFAPPTATGLLVTSRRVASDAEPEENLKLLLSEKQDAESFGQLRQGEHEEGGLARWHALLSGRPPLTRLHKAVLATVFIVLIAVAATTTALYIQTLRAVSPNHKTVNLRSAAATTFAYRKFSKPGVVAYWPNWAPYARPQNNIDQLDLNGVSIVVYSFLALQADGTVASSDSFSDQTYIPKLNKDVRNKYPNLLTSIAVGGYSLSTHFSTVAASDSLSRTFAQSIHQYMDENGFDGVDIDYEYPGGGSKCNAVSPDDAKNIVNFLRILRNELGADRLISFAISLESSPYTIGNVNYLLQYVEQVSFLGVMAYDVYSSWAPYSDISAPLSLPDISRPNSLSISTASGLDALTKAGVDKSKIVLGVPFYGHSWSVVSKGINNGLFQACSKPGQDLNNPTACPPPPGDNLDALGCDGCTVCTKAYSGMWFYFNLRGNNGAQRNAPLATGPLTAGNGWSRQYFDWAASPTLYNPSFQSTNSTGDVEAPYQAYISYEDPQSIEAKSRWAQSNGYAGIMAWEVSQDFQGELLSALKGAWAEASSPTQGTSLSTSPSASSSPPTSTGPSIPTSTPTTVARCAPDWATAQVYCGVPCPTKTDAECVASGTHCFIAPSDCIPPPTGNVSATPTSTSAPSTVNRCGNDWSNANTYCNKLCPTGYNSECPSGMSCFSVSATCTAPSTSPLSSSPTPSGTTLSSPSTGSNSPSASPSASPSLSPPASTASSTSGPPSTTSTPSTVNRCGTDWSNANTYCNKLCPTGYNSECPSGMSCFSVSLSCIAPPTSTLSSSPTSSGITLSSASNSPSPSSSASLSSSSSPPFLPSLSNSPPASTAPPPSNSPSPTGSTSGSSSAATTSSAVPSTSPSSPSSRSGTDSSSPPTSQAPSLSPTAPGSPIPSNSPSPSTMSSKSPDSSAPTDSTSPPTTAATATTAPASSSATTETTANSQDTKQATNAATTTTTSTNLVQSGAQSSFRYGPWSRVLTATAASLIGYLLV